MIPSSPSGPSGGRIGNGSLSLRGGCALQEMAPPLFLGEGRGERHPRVRASLSARPAGARHRQPGAPRQRNGLLFVGGILVGLVLALALLGLVWTPHDPLAMHPLLRGQGPSAAYLLGTDQYGRDILSRLLRGAWLALLVGGFAVGIGVVVGVPLGALAGFRRGWLDEAIMRAMDALLAFPAILLAIAIVGVLGPGLFHAMIAIGAAYVPIFARLARASVIGQLEAGYVDAARATGCRAGRILWVHILPNGLGPLIIQATVGLGSAILAEAALSYLGLGVQPPDPSWGQMLNDAHNYLNVAPWLAVFPGLAIAVTVLGFNLLGDGLRDRV